MNKVKILPPEIVSKIAAGEIIERPASVIKELVENALDAESTSLEVSLENAGKTTIRIKDNGSGIDKNDLKNIFIRHSTSKIEKLDDLYSIMSLGFRGEALYSIASIADVVLKSKPQEQTEGWEIHMRGGNEINLTPCTLPSNGTEIEIRELFFNTPVRKKFMKSNITEMHQVLNTFIPYTLLYKNIRFLLTHQDKTLIDLQPEDDHLERIASVLNLEVKHMINSDTEITDKNIKIKMILGDINITRSRRDMQYIFINNRPVQNKNISFHMNQIYRLMMPDGSHPFFCLFINMPPEDIDVNIHPAKREVKLRNENEICSMIRSLCEQTLMQKGSTKQVSGKDTERMPRRMDLDPIGSLEKYSSNEELLSSPLQTREPLEYSYPSSGTSTQYKDQSEFFLSHAAKSSEGNPSLRDKLSNAIYLGSFANKYQMFEINSSLLIIDQHAAQERITYELLIKQLHAGKFEVQHLLSPILIKLSPQELLVWEESHDKLTELGLENNQWDEETIAIHTHPLLIKDPEKAVRELLSGESLARCDHDEIARRACRSSVMSGDKMAKEQAEYQRETLINCMDPFTCPHGRPTVIEMSLDFLDKQFLRT